MLFFDWWAIFPLQALYIPPPGTASGVSPGDHVLLNKAICKYQAVQRGDVLGFINSDNRSQFHMKRVIGLPGDAIEIKSDDVLVNHQPAPLTPIPQNHASDKVSSSALMMEISDGSCYPITLSQAGNSMSKQTIYHGYCFVLGITVAPALTAGPVALLWPMLKADYPVSTGPPRIGTASADTRIVKTRQGDTLNTAAWRKMDFIDTRSY